MITSHLGIEVKNILNNSGENIGCRFSHPITHTFLFSYWLHCPNPPYFRENLCPIFSPLLFRIFLTSSQLNTFSSAKSVHLLLAPYTINLFLFSFLLILSLLFSFAKNNTHSSIFFYIYKPPCLTLSFAGHTLNPIC